MGGATEAGEEVGEGVGGLVHGGQYGDGRYGRVGGKGERSVG